jgi:asparagine synthase (glutamine-hydrolysing)
MSFFVVFNCDGAPVKGETIRAYHDRGLRNVKLLGPSSQTALMWVDPDTESEDRDVRHAVGLNEHLWLLGRVRLDARDELCAVLSASETEPDAFLCLRAYARWGENIVRHLRGDFCFTLWDEVRQILFCARDQLGVRPLFYGRVKNTWLVSDSLETVAGHSSPNDLDDFWIADFLFNIYSVDFDRTVYKNIKRLAPAHTVVASGGQSDVKRYWTLDIGEPIIYRQPSQYLDQFHDVLTRAVKDRLPRGRVGISLSGGLDSTTLAAKAVEVTGDASRVVAQTHYLGHLMPDEEPHFSALVAEKLKIAHRLLAVDDAYDPRFDVESPEPSLRSLNRAFRRVLFAEKASQTKVWFAGEGPDDALTFEWQSYLRWLTKRRDWVGLAGAIAQYIRGKEAREWLITIKKGIPRWREDGAISNSPRSFPPWINQDIVKCLDLTTRTNDFRRRRTHPWRPQAMAAFTSPFWPRYFESFDPAFSGAPLDWRHPYTDLRVLTFMLRTPPIPWARRKRLIREAMRASLPVEVLKRVKTPLAADPRSRVAWRMPPPHLWIDVTLRRFVDPIKLPDGSAPRSVSDPLAKLWALHVWLRKHHCK